MSVRRGQVPACIGEDPEIFFPKSSKPAAAEAAKEICRRCPAQFRQACRREATENREFGVWGATTEDERDGTPRGGRLDTEWQRPVSTRSGRREKAA